MQIGWAGDVVAAQIRSPFQLRRRYRAAVGGGRVGERLCGFMDSQTFHKEAEPHCDWYRRGLKPTQYGCYKSWLALELFVWPPLTVTPMCSTLKTPNRLAAPSPVSVPYATEPASDVALPCAGRRMNSERCASHPRAARTVVDHQETLSTPKPRSTDG